MKIKDILKYLNSEYILVSDDENEYFVEYLLKSDLSDEILNSDLNSIEPVVAIKKSLFVNDAGPNDYVTALKIITTDRPILEEETINVEEIYENEEERQKAKEKEQKTQDYERTNPYSQFGNFGDFNKIFSSGFSGGFGGLLTPELFENITQSDAFKEMMTPENINEILNSDDFKNFLQNFNLSDIMGGMGPASVNPMETTEEDTSDDDEYEEI